MSKCHIVGNLTHWLIFLMDTLQYLDGSNRLEYEYKKGLLSHDSYLMSGLVYPIDVKFNHTGKCIRRFGVIYAYAGTS